MAARRCTACGLNFPAEPEYKECPICGLNTILKRSEKPSENYEAELQMLARSKCVSADVKVVLYRFGRLQDAGLDVERSLLLAGALQVDVHDFEALLARGCSLDVAVRIVAP